MALKDLVLVYARNIGKGFKKNTETKQYDVALGNGLKLDGEGNIYVDIKDAGGVNLADVNNAISKDKTNELSLKDDGLYVGQKANYPTAYVDVVNGEDGKFEDGFGTREKPFKTLIHAINQGEYGKSYTIYLKECQEHIINRNTGFNCSKLNIHSYGDEIDACKHEYIDGFQHTVGIVRDRQIHAQIVFKGLNKYKYPENSDNFYYIFRPVRLYSNYSGLSVFNVSGVGFVIDLGSFAIETTEYTPSDRKLLAVDKGCIQVNGDIMITNFSFSSRGTPTVPSNVIKHEGNLNQYLREDLYSIGLFHVYGGQLSQITLRNWFAPSNSPRAKCMILAESGWAPRIDTKTSINFSNQYDSTSLAEIAKRVGNIYKKTLDGKPFIIAPLTDMNLEDIWNFN